MKFNDQDYLFNEQEFNAKLCYPSFPNLKIYEEILQDEVRILSYKAAIEMNKEIFKDKVKYFS